MPMSRRAMFWRMVISSILRRRSRVLIAVLAVAIGATTLSGLVTIAVDVPAQMAREIRSYGANLVVTPAGDVPITDEAVAAVPAPVPCVVGAVGLDRKIASASATTETTPMIAPAVRPTGEWSPAGLMRSFGVPVELPFGADVVRVSPPDEGDADRFRSATAASLRGRG